MATLKNSSQLTLPVQLPELAQFSLFVPGPNEMAVNYIRELDTHSFQHTAIVGSDGAGKTHFLSAMTDMVHNRGDVAMYVPLEAVRHQSPALLEGLEEAQLLALDNIDAVTSNAEWSVALFALINRFMDRQEGHLLWSSKVPARSMQIVLPDLQSRLQAATQFKLAPLDDNEKIQALKLHLKSRGLILNDDVAEFLLGRLSRGMHGLMQTVDALDQASMREQRRLTLPFVKQVLNL
ncbi:DnaA regulatory inactivator Hda [Aliidiomarina taiwanensis]|uniref:DnaA regulatory inactivator Hda n=1 Tax=Aliidiomarina taiwanensis TaxID=946228 RepID=UPI00130050EF|nr:DnaA regulatory inactivator Hda [Aliidiomarina taiwanensis]